MADPVVVDRLAFAFHWEYERSARREGWETQKASQVPWDDLPEANKATMRATVAALLDLGFIAPGPNYTPPSAPPVSPDPESTAQVTFVADGDRQKNPRLDPG